MLWGGRGGPGHSGVGAVSEAARAPSLNLGAPSPLISTLNVLLITHLTQVLVRAKVVWPRGLQENWAFLGIRHLRGISCPWCPCTLPTPFLAHMGTQCSARERAHYHMSQDAWVQIPVQPLTGWVTSDQSPDLSIPVSSLYTGRRTPASGHHKD